MRRWTAIALGLVVLISFAYGQRVRDDGAIAQLDRPTGRFTWVDVVIDTKGKALAAYQFEMKAVHGQVRIVGIEGNDKLPFRDPPFYDAKAIQQDRVILADYTTVGGSKLPMGKVRVATVHVEVLGEGIPEYGVKLTSAAGPDGEAIDAEIAVEEGTTP